MWKKIVHYFDVKIVACQITCAPHVMRGYITPNHCTTEKYGTMVTLNLYLIGVVKVINYILYVYAYFGFHLLQIAEGAFPIPLTLPKFCPLCGKEGTATLTLQPGTRIFMSLRGMYNLLKKFLPIQLSY